MTVSSLIAPKIQVGILDPQTARTNPAEHRRTLADAVSTVGAGMIIAQTKIVQQSQEDAITSATYADLSGLEQLVVVPIPARAYIHTILEVEVVNNAQDFNAQVVNGSTAISVTRTLSGVANGTILSVSIQTTLDLVKETLYTFKAQAKVAAAGGSYNVRTASTVMVRIESRSER